MIIAVGADHRGRDILHSVAEGLATKQYEIVTFFEDTMKQQGSIDYPDQAFVVSKAVSEGKADRGVLLCGSGIGMSIAANKVPGVRAALVMDEIGAEMSRRHNDANVLCIAADLIGRSVIERIVEIWLRTEFEGGRHARRVAKITAIEDGESPIDLQYDDSTPQAAS